MSELRLLAPAKINLCLDILRKRADGFHDLRTVFQAIDLGDELRVRYAKRTRRDTLTVTGPYGEGIPSDHRNMVLHAVKSLRQALGPSGGSFAALALELHKTVPQGAGLGGGSSDAVAALLAANDLWGGPASSGLLRSLAERLGSDCAFFLEGGTAEGGNRGEALIPWERSRPLPMVLIFPMFMIPTREAYAGLTAEDLGERSDYGALRSWLGDGGNFPGPMNNAFLRFVVQREPGAAAIPGDLREVGAFHAQLSGSGSTFFGLFDNPDHANEAMLKLREKGHRAVTANAVDHGVRVG